MIPDKFIALRRKMRNVQIALFVLIVAFYMEYQFRVNELLELRGRIATLEWEQKDTYQSMGKIIMATPATKDIMPACFVQRKSK